MVISAFTTIIDSDHTFAAGRPNVMHNPMVSSPVRVGEGTWIGERVAVLRGADIGRCYLKPCSTTCGTVNSSLTFMSNVPFCSTRSNPAVHTIRRHARRDGRQKTTAWPLSAM